MNTTSELERYGEEYHQRKCEESGKELPDDKRITEYLWNQSFDPKECGAVGTFMKWFRPKVSLLLASKQSQFETKDKEVNELMITNYQFKKDCYSQKEKIEILNGTISQLKENNSLLAQQKEREINELKFHVKKLEDLVFAKDGVILELRPKLQKSNEEVDRLNKEVNVLTETLNNPLDRR